MADVELQDHGSIMILMPLTESGRRWLEDHTPEEAQKWGNGTVVEPRHAGPIVSEMQLDGLVVA